MVEEFHIVLFYIFSYDLMLTFSNTTIYVFYKLICSSNVAQIFVVALECLVSSMINSGYDFVMSKLVK
jgi:hypothetical protein